MEGLTFSASRQGNSSELRNPAPITPASRPTSSSTGEAAVQDRPTPGDARAAAEVARVDAQGSAFQARLNYDQDKATVFVEILDPETGDVRLRIPAESAADRIRELTGHYGGSVIDKIA